jgi:hypothetical protein
MRIYSFGENRKILPNSAIGRPTLGLRWMKPMLDVEKSFSATARFVLQGLDYWNYTLGLIEHRPDLTARTPTNLGDETEKDSPVPESTATIPGNHITIS